jgi:hypothetical protein
MKTYNVNWKLSSEPYGWRSLEVQASNFQAALGNVNHRMSTHRGGKLEETVEIVITRVK